MSQTVELNQGEIKVNFSSPTKGKISLKDLGISTNEIFFENGLLRIVFDFEGIGKHNYFKIPTIEVSYRENMSETHWQCDFNEENILDKTDHHGHSTIILLNRDKLTSLEHHHKNALTLHAEFPESVHIDTNNTFLNFFQ